MRLSSGSFIQICSKLCLVPWALSAQELERLSLPETFARNGYEIVQLRRTDENHLFVFGKLNGHRRSVLVDTGWSFTTISTNTAGKLPWAWNGGTNEDPSVLVKELRLGHTSLTNQPMRVERIVFDGQPASFDIVLGCDFLRRNNAVVDCLNRRLYVRTRAPTETEQTTLEEALRDNGFSAVALKLKQPLAISCPAQVNGKPVEMLVDTAAVWSTLDVRQVNRLGLLALPTLAKIIGVGKTGTRGVAMAEAKSFSLGDVPMKDTSFALMDLSDWGFAAPGTALSKVQGILGGSELVANSALVDCHGLKLWVKHGGVKKQ